MRNIDVLLDIFFPKASWPEKVKFIKECGYNAIETWQGGDIAVMKQIGDACKENGVKFVSIVMNFATESDVAPINSANLKNFVERIDKFSDNALNAGVQSGIVTAGQTVGGKGYQSQRAALVEALKKGGELAAEKGFNLNLEPLNTEVDHAGYFIDDARDAAAIVKEIGLNNVKLTYDIYHMGIMGGNLTSFLINNANYIGHVHVAGIPGRNELFYGETNYPFILDKLESAGYKGYFGLEYFPKLDSAESLRKTLDYLNK